MTSDNAVLSKKLTDFLQRVGMSERPGAVHESTQRVFKWGEKQRERRNKAHAKTPGKGKYVAQTLTPEQQWGAEMACKNILSSEKSALRGAIMAHSMGLGKTLIGVEVSRAFLHEHRGHACLVVVAAPATLCEQWQEELENQNTFGAYCFFENDVQACRVSFSLPPETDPEHVKQELTAIAAECNVDAESGTVSNLKLHHVRLVRETLHTLSCTAVRAHFVTTNQPDITVEDGGNFFTGLRIHAGAEVAANSEHLQHYDYLIISHTLFENNHAGVTAALSGSEALLVLDEAQRAKNETTTLHQAVQVFAGKRLLLTATPMEIHIDELWSLARLILPSDVAEADGIAADLLRALEVTTDPPLLQVELLMKKYQDTQDKTEDTTEKYRKVINYVNTCMFSFMDRLGPSVLSQELQRENPGVQRSEFLVECKCSSDGRSALNTYVTPSASRDSFLVNCIAARQPSGTGRKTIVFLWYKDYLRHVTALMETRCDMRMIEKLNKRSVFSSYQDEATDDATTQDRGPEDDTMSTEDTATPHTYAVLHGQMPAAERQEAIRAFKNDPHCTVLVANIKVGGVGLNLQDTADTVIFVNSDWNPANMEQAAGRIWRRGQTRSCSILHLVVRYDGTFTRTNPNPNGNPTAINNEHAKFTTMIQRVIASANFLDGKYLVGDDSDMFQSISPSSSTAATLLNAYGTPDVNMKRIIYDMVNVVNVSDGLGIDEPLSTYKVKKNGKELPIYDKGSGEVTAAFTGIATEIRKRLLQDVYHCTVHNVFFFQSEISTVPPLLYPLNDEQLKRVQEGIPKKYRMAFKENLTPDLLVTPADNAYAKRNESLSRELGDDRGVVLLCTDQTGLNLDEYQQQRAPLLVCLLQLLLHTKGILPENLRNQQNMSNQLKTYLAVLREAHTAGPVRAYPLLQSIAKCPRTAAPEPIEVQAAKDLLKHLHIKEEKVSVAPAGADTTCQSKYLLLCAGPGEHTTTDMVAYPPYVYDSGDGRPRVHVEKPAGQTWILGDGVAERSETSLAAPPAARIYTLWEKNVGVVSKAATQRQRVGEETIDVTFENYESPHDSTHLSLPGTVRLGEAKKQLVEALQRKEGMAGDDTKIYLELVNEKGGAFRGADTNVNMGMTLQNNLEDGKIWYKIKQHQVKWIPVSALKPAVEPEKLKSTFRFGINVGDAKAELEKKHDRAEFTLYKDDSLSATSRASKAHTINKAFREVDDKLQIHYTAEAMIQLHLNMDTPERAKQLLAKFQGGSTFLRATLPADQVTITAMVRKGTTAQRLQRQLNNAVQMQDLKAKLSGVVDDTALEDGARITVQFQTSAKAKEMVVQEWRSVGGVPAPDVAVVNKLPKTLSADTKVADLYQKLDQEYDGHRYRWQLFEDENGKKNAVDAKLLTTVYKTGVIYYTGVKLVRVTVTNVTPKDTTPSQVSFDDRLRQITRVPNTENDVYIEQGKTVGDLLALLKQKTDDDAIVEGSGGVGGLTRVLTDGDAVAVVLRPRGKVTFRVVSETDGQKLEGVEDAVLFEDHVQPGVFRKVKRQIGDKFKSLHNEQGLLLRFKPTTEPGNLRGITQFDFPASIVRNTPTLPGQGAQGGGPAPGDFIMH